MYRGGSLEPRLLLLPIRRSRQSHREPGVNEMANAITITMQCAHTYVDR